MTKSKNNTRRSSRLPSDSSTRLSFSRVVQGLVLITLVSIVSYFLMRGTLSGTASPAAVENQSASAELHSMTQAEIKSDQSGSTVNIKTRKGVNGAEQNNLMQDIKYATRGDGNIRPVKVDGKALDPTVVKLAMFDNHDFQPRDETAVREKPAHFDTSHQPAKRHFRKMTYPLVHSGGALGTDDMARPQDK